MKEVEKANKALEEELAKDRRLLATRPRSKMVH